MVCCLTTLREVPSWIHIVILSCCVILSQSQDQVNIKGNCDQLLDTFAENTAKFTSCAIRNARPITFCENCVTDYICVLDSYQEIFEMKDEAGQPCKIKLLNLDRLEIIEAIFKSVAELWSRGECDYCFDMSSNGTLTNRTRDTTKEFRRRHTVAQECIQEHRNDSGTSRVCDICRTPYCHLNTYYNTIKIQSAQADKDNICMDIVDLMNATRTEWSKDLHCIPIRQSQLPLFISATIVLVTPVIFYAFSILFSWNR